MHYKRRRQKSQLACTLVNYANIEDILLPQIKDIGTRYLHALFMNHITQELINHFYADAAILSFFLYEPHAQPYHLLDVSNRNF